MWYYSSNNTQQGPVDEAAIPQLLANGTLHPASLVWREAMADWSPLNQTGLARFLEPAGVPSPAWASPPTPPVSDSLNPYLPPQAAPLPLSMGPATPMTWGKILWSFEGRIPRRTYWAATGVLMGIFFVVSLATGMLAAAVRPSSGSGRDVAIIFSILPLFLCLPLVWCSIAIQVKRWHDRGKSGAMVLINFIPYLGGIWAFVECGCLRGSVGQNPYGQDPT